MVIDPAAQSHLDLLKAIRQERREDLDGVAQAHIGNTATHILLTSQARLQARLIDADPNAPVDLLEPIGEADLNFTDPPVPEESS